MAITETELKVIAALAIIGDKSKPKSGYKIPANRRAKFKPSDVAGQWKSKPIVFAWLIA